MPKKNAELKFETLIKDENRQKLSEDEIEEG